MVSTTLQRLIWRDGFPGPICARAWWFMPVCNEWAEFADGIGRDHCARMFEQAAKRHEKPRGQS